MNKMDDLVASVLQAVEKRRAETVELLAATIRVPSVTGKEGLVGPLYADVLGQMGLEVQLQYADVAVVAPHYPFLETEPDLGSRPNVIARWPGRLGDRTLAIIGHMDVVTPGDESLWETPPFTPTIRDGKMFGRGTADMKGGLAATIAAVRALRDLGIELDCNLDVQCMMGEELGGLGATIAILQGERVDAVICPEPTENVVCPASSGHLKLTLEVDGLNAHTALPWLGVSAFEKMWLVYETLAKLSQERSASVYHPLFEHWPNKAPFAIGREEAGTYGWMVPSTATAVGRFGVLPGEEPEEAQRAVEKALLQLASSDPWLREHPPRVKWTHGSFTAWETPGDDPLVQALETAARAVRPEAQNSSVTYGTDASKYVELTGCPAVVFGPGSVREAHFPNEYVAIEEVIEAAQVLALSVLAWDGAATRKV